MMFSNEEENVEQSNNKPQFETGFNRGNDIIVNITRHIDSSNIVMLIATIDEWVDKFYSSAPINSGCKVVCLFNAYGEDLQCVTLFSNYMKGLLEKKPKVSFVGLLEYAEGNVALMYMLMHERITKPDARGQSQSGIVKMGQSALLFNVVPTQYKNEIAKYLFDNKIDKNVIQLCFPVDEKTRIQYCGETIQESGFAKMNNDEN